MLDFGVLRRAWAGDESAGDGDAPEWPQAGIAIEGDFSGIQRFVLRPVPGAGGAARRLRARSFRVLALTRLVARSVEKAFEDAGAKLFYSAGGRFLVVARRRPDWAPRLGVLQRSLDEELLREYRGELVFHLAGAEYSDGRIPGKALSESLNRRKRMPLGEALRTAEGWATERFFFRPPSGARCDGCAGTEEVRLAGGEQLCATCLSDRELGGRLLGHESVGLVAEAEGPLGLLGERWAVAGQRGLEISWIGHAPKHNGQLATFEELAGKGLGRPYLGYLRIDGDRIGEAFARLENQPLRIRGLSLLLDRFFSARVEKLLAGRFTNIYPVYGGGDDLFVIGPWQDTLGFASALQEEFRAITDGGLTLSAGMALAKKKQHILAKADEAEDALTAQAKAKRDSIHALGATMGWGDFRRALEAGRKLGELRARGKLRSAMLQNILELHQRWRQGDGRWHSLLYYQVERNLRESPEAGQWVKSAFLKPGEVWPQADFAVRYAMLAGSGEEKGE